LVPVFRANYARALTARILRANPIILCDENPRPLQDGSIPDIRSQQALDPNNVKPGLRIFSDAKKVPFHGNFRNRIGRRVGRCGRALCSLVEIPSDMKFRQLRQLGDPSADDYEGPCCRVVL
jgi:hypothetical protein